VTPSASVILPVYNARELVCDQLDALAEQVVGSTVECIVIDDASTDGTTDAIRAWIDRTGNSAKFRVVTRAARGGPNASRNDGIRQARSDFLMFTDGDDIVAAGWIDAFASLAAKDGLLCGRNADVVGRSNGGEVPPDAIDWVPPWFGGWQFAYGNCMAGPRRIFEEPGGFDENIRLGGSETEFAIRAQRQFGIDVVGVPEALVWYRIPTTAWGLFRKHFARERGYAYIRRRHRGAVHRSSVRIGLVQIGRGVFDLVTTRTRTRTARPSAMSLVARGAGGILGNVWWRTVYQFRVPPPQLLDIRGHPGNPTGER